jgi:hypothetical protein
MEQLVLTASDAGQLLVSANAEGVPPLRATLEIVSGAVPLFVTVPANDAEVAPRFVAGKVSADGEKVRVGAAAAVPVPVRVMIWGEPFALSVTVIVALKFPILGGVNVSANEHWAAGASEAPQVLVIPNTEAFVPPSATLVKVRAVVPVFVSVIAFRRELLLMPAVEERLTVMVEIDRAAVVTGAVLGVPPPLHPARRTKHEARTASERRLRSMGDPDFLRLFGNL